MSLDIERLARVETRLESIDTDLKRVDAKLDIWMKHFPSREEVQERFASKDKEIKSLWYEIEEIKSGQKDNSDSIKTWVSIAIAAASIIIAIYK